MLSVIWTDNGLCRRLTADSTVYATVDNRFQQNLHGRHGRSLVDDGLYRRLATVSAHCHSGPRISTEPPRSPRSKPRWTTDFTVGSQRSPLNATADNGFQRGFHGHHGQSPVDDGFYRSLTVVSTLKAEWTTEFTAVSLCSPHSRPQRTTNFTSTTLRSKPQETRRRRLPQTAHSGPLWTSPPFLSRFPRHKRWISDNFRRGRP